MRLLIVSHTPHYRNGREISGWGPTVREIDHLASLFDEVIHVAPLYRTAPPNSSLAYSAENVRLRPVRPSGGVRLRDKVSILICLPAYLWAIWSQLRNADVVHVRCPANISLLAVLLLALTRRPRLRWIKYAGNWKPTSREALSYTLQRWWLLYGPHRGLVTVNGQWPDQPRHVRSFFNPSLTDEEARAAHTTALAKVLTPPIRLLFVGRLESSKGVATALQVASRLHEHALDFVFELVGDGPERAFFADLAVDLGISEHVHFHGWIPRQELITFYSVAHLFLFPSRSEGWPKVLSEAMAYGVVPIASNVSSIPGYLAAFGCGRSIDATCVKDFAHAILEYTHHPEEWQRESWQAAQSAAYFTYSHHLAAVATILGLPVPKTVPP